MGRIQEFSNWSEVSEEYRSQFSPANPAQTNGPIVGPARVLLHIPDIALKARQLGGATGAGLRADYRETVISTVAREWSVNMHSHSIHGRRSGKEYRMRRSLPLRRVETTIRLLKI